MTYQYLGYSSPHYVLDRDDGDNNNAEYYYLMSAKGGDVHRIGSSCVKNVSAGLVPCNIMSGDYHGTDSDDYWSRVHAPIANESCKPTKNDCTGYRGDTKEHGFELDGSVYSDDKGVTVGEKGEPTDSSYLFINKYGSDINIPNAIIGRPPNLSSNQKYKKLTLFKTYSDTQKRDFSINNGGDAIINNQGQLDINIYVSQGKLSVDWDEYADTQDIYDGADEPCSPKGGDASYLTWGHECAICNARADFARKTTYEAIREAFECYLKEPPPDCSYWGQKACVLGYGCDGDWHYVGPTGVGDPTQTPPDPSNNCASYYGYDSVEGWEWIQNGDTWTTYGDADHPCGEDWESDPEGMLEQELYKIHQDQDFVQCRTIECALYRYREMCFNDCNEGTNIFGDGHPTSASCRDSFYESDGGRWSDLHHACGSTDGVRNFRTVLNKP